MSKSDISLILLAGGEGTRMRQITIGVPKALLPIFDESLLQRHVVHASEAGIKQIIISTKPKWRETFIKHLSVTNLISKVKVISNSDHEHGSLPALLSVLRGIEFKYLLMSFVDIFSFDNPYINFMDVQKDSCVFGISDPFDEVQLSRGGIVFTKNNKVQSIRERPLKGNHKGYRWNGVSYFPKKLKTDLRLYLVDNPKDSPEGDFFEFWRSMGGKITYKKCSDFINVNTPEDLLLASLYNCALKSRSTTQLKVAEKLRRNSLSNIN